MRYASGSTYLRSNPGMYPYQRGFADMFKGRSTGRFVIIPPRARRPMTDSTKITATNGDVLVVDNTDLASEATLSWIKDHRVVSLEVSETVSKEEMIAFLDGNIPADATKARLRETT